MPDIFISYAREDRSRVEPLATALEDLGWSVFWDRTIPAGKTWRQVIGDALKSARAVIVAWSKTSVDSSWVQEEADSGRERNILIPILIDNVKPPLGFGAIQAADLINWEPKKSSQEFENLISDLSVILGPFPLKVRETEQKGAEEEQRRRQEEDEAKRKTEEDQRRKEQEEQERKAAMEKRRNEQELKRKAEEERQKKEAEAKRIAEKERKQKDAEAERKEVKAEPKPDATAKPEPKSPEPRKPRNVLIFGVITGVVVLMVVGILRYISKPQQTFTNTIGMNFVLIPKGKFVMGSPPDEAGRSDDEKQHEVNISKAFYLQTTEVSQAQWKRVMEDNPSYFKECGDECPVENVSWDDTQKFISKLNQMEGTTNKYRLPTEAEWEYACRAGMTTPFFTGECISTDQANYNGNNPGEICPKGQYRKKTVKVGSFQPNAWGLYDMHGNVYEWCEDWYGNYPADPGPIIDPTGSAVGIKRVLRGGSWSYYADLMRSASRGSSDPDYRTDRIGFRVARNY